MSVQCALACETAMECIQSCANALRPPPLPKLSDLGMGLGLLALSGLFSGLTLGLMSLDPQQLELVIAGGSDTERYQAERILPLRKRGNLLLCTLLIGNTMVNAALAIITASFTTGVIGGFVSTAFILVFGEIIPQAVCSRNGLAAGSLTIDIVRFFMAGLFVIAWPISKLLDRLLGQELGTIYSREELKELFTQQAEGRRSNDAIRRTEADFMIGALSLSERLVSEIMTSIKDVFIVYSDEELNFKVSRSSCEGVERSCLQ